MATMLRSTMLGAGVGAAVMFLLDPARGARRRALLRDKLTRAAHKSRDAYGVTRRDVANRIHGTVAQVQSRLHEDAADGVTIERRVRAALGRVSSHPRAIHVSASDGFVTLSGDALGSEHRAIESAVRGVRGVKDVTDGLTVHANAEGIPALQGGSPRADRWSTWIRGSWSPAAKAVAAAGVATASFVAGAATRKG